MKKKIIIFVFIAVSNLIQSQCYTNITAGGGHILGKKSNNNYFIWGYGGFGQLGNTTAFDEYQAIPLPSTFTWLKLSCGSINTFGVKTDGTLWGTGSNLYGSLGVGSIINNVNVFTQIGSANNWKEISPSENFTVALKTDNTIWGWGQNDGYQMGNGTCCNDQLSPILISSLTDWKQVDGSDSRSVFAIKNNGTLWCWGSNLSSMLGDNLISSVFFPTQHNTATDWKEMSVGYDHMLILKTNNTLWAWGNGEYGSCGDTFPVTYNRYEPTQIGTDTWKMVAAGFRTSFGIKPNGTLWAWGRNDLGQLGDGSTIDRRLPVQIGTANNWDSISCGRQFTVALKTDGSLWAWGDNFYGQLGNGTTTSELLPTLIPVAGCTLGNDEFGLEKNSFSIAPNPSNGITIIEFSTNSTPPTIEIYSILGNKISSYTATSTKGSWNVDTSVMPSGIYIVVLKENGLIVSQQKLSIK